MTLNELIDFANAKNLSGEMTLRVAAFGTIGGYPAIDKAAIGFDWNIGSIVLMPVCTLEAKQKKGKVGGP